MADTWNDVSVSGPAPLHQMRGVQALAAHSAPRSPAIAASYSAKDMQLVLGGEGTPPGTLGSRTHHPIVGRHRHRVHVRTRPRRSTR